MIHAFDTSLPIHMYCDAARSRGVGIILLQPTNNKEAPFNLIQCGSTHLSEIQKRYSTNHIELLALLYALEKTDTTAWGHLNQSKYIVTIYLYAPSKTKT